jgi:hypothetical protein
MIAWYGWLLIGVVAGMVIMFFMVRGQIGDDYKISKPKVKGRGNSLRVRLLKNRNKDENKEC